MQSTTRRYQIGLAAIMVFTLVLVGVVVAQAAATKQDAKTQTSAEAIADQLNAYVDSQQSTPASLAEVGAKNVPQTISYTKLSNDSYRFCMAYHAASSGFDADAAVSDVASGGLAGKYSSLSSSADIYRSESAGYLTIPTSHKPGRNCQTVTLTLGDSFNVPVVSGTNSTKNSLPSISGFGTGLSGANDTERQTDLRALQSQLEATYDKNYAYPTLTQLNDPTWRAANMPGLDKEALRDPLSTSYTVSALATKGMYAYAPKTYDGQVCDTSSENSCDTYTLFAVLDTGSTYKLTDSSYSN